MAPLDFVALKDLHNSANNLLHSPIVQQAIVHQTEEKWFDDVSESSLRMLEVCGISKDVLLLVKEHLQELQFTFRRASIGDPGIEEKIAAYNCYRKKLKKETLKWLKWLKKGMKSQTATMHPPMFNEQKLVLVVDVLREVRMTSICIVESLLSLVSSPWLDTKSGKLRSFTSKLVRVSLHCCSDDMIYYDAMVLQSENKRLAGVRMAIEDLEVELECMFRRLIHTRVLLLNILTK
ncbi:hypothetical protein GLYMA_20G002500v4 [Glycine max]|uniref:Uncharacterized protein n=1 Tax=Glycine max TaxID=3847 RepID=I1NCX2_SOYBN|nr:uncharacterized protein LOC100786510 [Glycine max]KAH1033876.1 hypothetical protein GYH30_054338 [Glycine max]KRG89122.1 hypothetical protein GLYMA_20G002500v4 [Glycine max]|eukprot:XP_003556600.1 uncharacterized protein LOC100786510 [Glycine max]